MLSGRGSVGKVTEAVPDDRHASGRVMSSSVREARTGFRSQANSADCAKSNGRSPRVACAGPVIGMLVQMTIVSTDDRPRVRPGCFIPSCVGTLAVKRVEAAGYGDQGLRGKGYSGNDHGTGAVLTDG